MRPALPSALTCSGVIGVSVSTQAKLEPRDVFVPAFACFSSALPSVPACTSKR
jgi:hypothetical protein